jgi:hypothetical protein
MIFDIHVYSAPISLLLMDYLPILLDYTLSLCSLLVHSQSMPSEEFAFSLSAAASSMQSQNKGKLLSRVSLPVFTEDVNSLRRC